MRFKPLDSSERMYAQSDAFKPGLFQTTLLQASDVGRSGSSSLFLSVCFFYQCKFYFVKKIDMPKISQVKTRFKKVKTKKQLCSIEETSTS